jgi:hypothetical protein
VDRTEPAKAIKPPKVTHSPTLPFDEQDIKRAFEAADNLADWGSFGQKLKAMVLLRHSGLRLQDMRIDSGTRLRFRFS